MDERLAWVGTFFVGQQTSDEVEEIVRALKNELSPEDHAKYKVIHGWFDNLA